MNIKELLFLGTGLFMGGAIVCLYFGSTLKSTVMGLTAIVLLFISERMER